MEPVRQIFHHLAGELSDMIPTAIVRLVVAAVLGGVIGLERELRHKPAGLRTNMFICFGAALYTILSDVLAGEHTGDHTRIAAQIIPGIGFIGAGSILHARGSVTGLTTAATLFVVASIGMAAGGGLYLTAAFATGLILISLSFLGKAERHVTLKEMLIAYEVTGPGVEAVLAEVNRLLQTQRKMLQDVHAASSNGHSRLVFSVEASQSEQKEIEILLHESSLFFSVKCLGAAERE
ncbi:MAG: MgtC/SapB family protein [Acidobacteria bacterium]|nr:MgtC/SapB family protein [Acidobacteriota bacterium]MBV8893700.1 MgtC/SapB family protein [Acidobacteriota bacterium]